VTDSAIEAEQVPASRSLTSVVSRLAAANLTLLVLSFVTGPLQARALGPTGRGDLAAIFVPAGLIATVFSFGLGSYAIVATARGERDGALLGTIGALYIGLGLIVAAIGVPIAHVLADGRHVVFVFLVISFATAPITLLALLVLDVCIGAQEWRPVIRTRLCTTLVASLPIIVLYAIGQLTVTSAAIASTATIVSYVFPVSEIRRRRPRLQWDGRIAREGIRFGAKAWLGGLTNVTSARLDQLLMIRLVSSAELGEYAVAVNLSAFFVTPIMSALLVGTTSRIATGETQLVARSSRLVIAGVGASAAAIAAISPFALRYLFGASFTGALPATLVLLGASVPLALSGVYGSAVSSAGRPGIAATAEAIGAAVTVIGLLTLLGPLGILGAAIVSFVAYTSTCVYLYYRSQQLFGGSLAEFVVPRSEEIRELGSRVFGVLRRARTRLRKGESA
jgi:O-antigen/teichoic acid export membrane protein